MLLLSISTSILMMVLLLIYRFQIIIAIDGVVKVSSVVFSFKLINIENMRICNCNKNSYKSPTDDNFAQTAHAPIPQESPSKVHHSTELISTTNTDEELIELTIID